ncbi:MAG: hypothetical protein IPK50_00335 [Fibrobacterota bacterium]|nr:MAG: hypothetical protein IPK50_00335 [Fibrobacterota bacterium]
MLALVCALLFSCSDDDRVAGGSGTHLPQPTARLLDTNLQPLHAEVWRLWRLDGDVAVPTRQIVNPNGFLVPDEGLWIVEAWRDTAHAGLLDGLSSTQATGMDSCIKALTYLPGTESDRVGVLACRDLSSPTRQSRSGGSPLGVGLFGTQAPIQQIVRVPTSTGINSDVYRFMVFKIDWDNFQAKTLVDGKEVPARIPVRYDHERISAERGLVDISLRTPRTHWLFIGWGGTDLDSFWHAPPGVLWADSLLLSKCLVAGNLGACKDQPFLGTWPDGVNSASVHFVVRVP